MSEYYVYVYIDPRNFEEFYFGKGKGSRMNAHLTEDSDSGKSTRIKAIHAAGLEPIVRVIARGLSEHDAFLVEKTLLWKLGKNLTNVSSGRYAENFRPHDTLHLLLSGFDFNNGIYYYNVGEGPHRNWDDYREFGYISAGQGVQWRDPMLRFHPGDLVAAYLKGLGYVGIGRILERGRPIRDVQIDGAPLLSRPLRSKRAWKIMSPTNYPSTYALWNGSAPCRGNRRNGFRALGCIRPLTFAPHSMGNRQP